MPFSGELVHGAFLRWLRNAAPDVAAWLHEGQKRRLFTCSSLHFSRPVHTMFRAERENIHLPLDPEKTYTVRLTLLLGDLFPLFYKALMQFNLARVEASAPPFIQLGKQYFLLEEVVLANDEPWTGFTSLHELVEKARKKHFGSHNSLTLEFGSLTTFNRGSKKTGYGPYPVLVPMPHYVFQNLLMRWEDIAPPELFNVIQKEAVEKYLEEDGIILTDYELTSHYVHFTTHKQRGFVGACTYQLRGHDQELPEDAPLTIRQQIYLLTQLAFYSGVGYKTAMGMGQTIIRG
jgi:CRISPR-associated endoribonuclease Cas6